MTSSVFFVLCVALVRPALAAFGISNTANGFRVDTAGGLTFDVNKYGNFTVDLEQYSPAVLGAMATLHPFSITASNIRRRIRELRSIPA